MIKRTKESVDYGKGMPSAHCSICRHFFAPAACKRVEGTISPKAWCKLFMRKE